MKNKNFGIADLEIDTYSHCGKKYCSTKLYIHGLELIHSSPKNVIKESKTLIKELKKVIKYMDTYTK